MSMPEPPRALWIKMSPTMDRFDAIGVLTPIVRRAMYENTEKFIDLDFEQKVRQTAYHLWEEDGRPFGRETDYWFQAIGLHLADRIASTPSDAGATERAKPKSRNAKG